MNVEISEKLIQNSQKIDTGIRKLQGRLSDVIDRYTEKNANPNDVIQKYKDELAAIKAELREYLRQQKEFDRSVQSADKEISMMTSDLKNMMLQNNINVAETTLQRNIP